MPIGERSNIRYSSQSPSDTQSGAYITISPARRRSAAVQRRGAVRQSEQQRVLDLGERAGAPARQRAFTLQQVFGFRQRGAEIDEPAVRIDGRADRNIWR